MPKPAQAPAPVPIRELDSTSSPPLSTQTQPGSFTSPLAAGSTPSINPAALNNEPAVIPSASPTAVKLSGSVDSEAKVPAVTPTVAETGVPVSGGPGGPGPSSGSLRDIRSSSQAVSNVAAPEGGSTKQYESAEEEKRRLAREERERLLQGDTPSSDPPVKAPTEEGETPPPYQDI